MKLVYMLISRTDIKTNGLFKANVLKSKGQTCNLKWMWKLKKEIKTSSFRMGDWQMERASLLPLQQWHKKSDKLQIQDFKLTRELMSQGNWLTWKIRREKYLPGERDALFQGPK